MENIEDQLNIHEGKINDLETKVKQESTLTEEMRRDVDELQVANRLSKRLETNLDKLVNKLDAIYEQIPAAVQHGGDQRESTEARFTRLEQIEQTNLSQMQHCVTYKVNESISVMTAEFGWMKEQLKCMKEEQELINAKIEKLCARVEEMCEVPSKNGYIWVVNGIEAKIKWSTMAEWSPVFKLHGYPFSAQAVMQTKNNDVFLYLSFKDVGNFRALSKLKFLPRVTFSLCDANANHDTNDIAKICDPPYLGSSFQYNTSYYGILLCQKVDVLTPKFIFNDSISVKIAVGDVESEQPASTNGSLLWTVDNYQKRRKMEENRTVPCQQSPWWYTSEKGYRVKAELELRYGTIKVRIFFISGEFDAELTSSFSHNTTVTLVDQAPTWLSKTDRTVSIRKSNIQDKSYELNLSLKSDLNDFKDNYLKDDSIIVKIEIQTSVPS